MRPSPLQRAGPAAVLVLLVTLLAGCGSSSSVNGIESRTPAQIVTAARAAAHGAATVHITGRVSNEGTPLSLDLELVAGKGGQGRIVQGDLDFELIEVARFIYIKGSPAFYRHIGAGAAARLLRGRWLKARASGSFASLAALTNLGKLVDTTLTSHGTLARNGTTTVDGQRVVAISDVSKGGTLYVATVGSPYPIEVLRHGGSGGRIVFDRWNKPVSLAAPANAINVNQLQGARRDAP